MYHPHRLLIRTTAPATEPLTLAETKLYLRVDGNTEDALITDLIVAARMSAEEVLRKSLITQTWKLAFDDYAPCETPLPRGPVQNVTSVTAVARDASTQTISSSTYALNAAKDFLMFDSIVYGFRIEIVYVAGYGTSSDVPKPIKYGMLSHIARMFECRGDAPLPAETQALYQPFRELGL